MKRSPLRRSPMKRRNRRTGPSPAVWLTVLERDGGACLYCGDPISGERGRDWSIGHRRPRRMGGDPRPETNSPANLVTLHGSGTTGCHGDIESRRADAVRDGWILHDHDIPAAVPLLIHRGARWVYLTDDGQIGHGPAGEDGPDV